MLSDIEVFGLLFSCLVPDCLCFMFSSFIHVCRSRYEECEHHPVNIFPHLNSTNLSEPPKQA